MEPEGLFGGRGVAGVMKRSTKTQRRCKESSPADCALDQEEFEVGGEKKMEDSEVRRVVLKTKKHHTCFQSSGILKEEGKAR